MSINQKIKPASTTINANGNLEIGGCDLVELANEYSTPLYIMDEATLRGVAREYKKAFSRLENVNMMFASKALMVSAIAKILSQEGFGFDVVSSGELYTIKNANADMKNVTFNGNNKTYDELEMALDLGVGRISADNFLELALLNEIAKSKNIKQKILLRITPGIECHTHEYIQTGHLDSKFGFDLTQIDEAIELILQEYTNLELTGLHAHIGSQIFETQDYFDEIGVILKEIKRIKDKFAIELYEINAGGGLGVTYTDEDCPPSIETIAQVFAESIEKHCKEYNLKQPVLYIEPGRSIVATAGVTLYTIGSSKQVPNGKKYIAVDGGMADNPRPSMYGAKYFAQIANKKEGNNPQKVTVAGRFCESGDILIKDIELNDPQEGDLLCVYNTGAYGYSMSSNYNRVLKPAMVLVNSSQSDIIVKRETLEQLIRNDVIPDRI